MSKKKESIWTKDLTPGFVNFMTMDITPDFKSPLWTKDITHHIVGTLAIFGLVVASFVTAAGVAELGTNADLALAQMVSASQSASVANAPRPQMTGSSTPQMQAQTTGTSTPQFCPQISRTIARGNSDASSSIGDVTQLQLFLSNHFGLDSTSTITGYFGSTTQNYLEQFQQSQGIPPTPMAGPLTRAAIQKVCGGGQMGSSTPPMRPAPPRPQATTSPVSFYNSPESDNAASAIVGVEEISDGVSRLLQASLGVLGL